MNALSRRTRRHLILIVANVAIYLSYPRLIFKFFRRLRAWPRASVPRSYSEKMLWRKIFDVNPVFTILCDKLAVKRFVQERSDEIKVPATLWEGADFADMPTYLLDRDIVAKVNDGHESVRLFRTGKVSHQELAKLTRAWMNHNHGRRTYERGYWTVPRKLFIEEMLLEYGEPVQRELKFHVFDGKVYIANMILDRRPGVRPRSCTFDREGNKLGALGTFGGVVNEPLPISYAPAVAAAEAICRDLDYARCDMYLVGDEFYLGEITLYPGSGMWNLRSKEHVTEMGRLWDIRKSWFLRSQQRWPLNVYIEALCEELDEGASGKEKRTKLTNVFGP